MAKKKKKTSAPIFPPETGETRLPSPALQSPTDAAAMASGYAGLGSGGVMGEEWIEQRVNEMVADSHLEEFLEHLRVKIWEAGEIEE